MHHTTAGDRTTRRIAVSPVALVIFAHCTRDDLHDNDAPLWCDPRDMQLAGEVSHLDPVCEGDPPCDSEAAVSITPYRLFAVTAHACTCTWYADWLAARDTEHAVRVGR